MALRERGIDVVFGMGSRFRELVTAQGFPVRPIYMADPQMLLDGVRTLDFSARDQHLPRYLESDLRVLESVEGMDLVLSDFRFMIRFAADHLGVPHVALANGYHTPYYDVLPELPDIIGSRLPGKLRHAKALRRFLSYVVPRQQALPARRVAKQAGVKSNITTVFDIAVSGALTLICDLPQFTPQKALPDNYQFVGPIPWEPPDAPGLPLELAESDRPLVYVTLGTSGDQQTLDAACEAFADAPVNVVLSTGTQAPRSVPGNFFATPFVKATSVLERASLMVCHGGNGSIYQAIAAGVPLVCVTSFYDQEWNAQRVRELGIGEAVFYQHVTAKRLRELSEQVMYDASYRDRLQPLMEEMTRWNGPARAAELIESFAAGL